MKFGFVLLSHDYNIILNKDDFLDHEHKKTGKSFKYARIRLTRDKATISDYDSKEEKKEVLNNLYFMDDKGEMQHIQFLNIIIED